MQQLVDIVVAVIGFIIVFGGAMIAVSEVTSVDLSTKQLVGIVSGIFIGVPVIYLTVAISLGIG